MTAERSFSAAPWSVNPPPPEEIVARTESPDPMPYAAPSTAVYDSTGTARAVQKITTFNTSGNAQNVTNGWVYDSTGTAKKFFSASNVKAPPAWVDYTAANFMFIAGDTGVDVTGWSAGVNTNDINPAYTTGKSPHTTPLTNSYPLIYQRNDVSGTAVLVYSWNNSGNPELGAFEALAILNENYIPLAVYKRTTELTYATGSSVYQWSVPAAPLMTIGQTYGVAFYNLARSTNFTVGTLGAKTGYINGVIGSMGSLNVGPDAAVREITTDGTTLVVRLQVFSGTNYGHSYIAYVDIPNGNVNTRKANEATYNFYQDTDSAWIMQWAWPETDKMVNGATFTINIA